MLGCQYSGIKYSQYKLLEYAWFQKVVSCVSITAAFSNKTGLSVLEWYSYQNWPLEILDKSACFSLVIVYDIEYLSIPSSKTTWVACPILSWLIMNF